MRFLDTDTKFMKIRFLKLYTSSFKREERENLGFRSNKRGTNKKQKKERRGRIVSLLFIARVCVYIYTHTQSLLEKEEEIW